jgi:hypothetical protein
MAMKPNYGRDRAERERAARNKKQEKLQEKQQRAQLRKVDGEPDGQDTDEAEAETPEAGI